jgi:putative tricarboxylic transport membrane protein
MFDLLIAVVFGVLGYLMKKTRFEPAPMLLGMVLGPMLEDNFRQSLVMSGGSFTTFLTRPISAAFCISGILLLTLPTIRWLRGEKTRLAEKLAEG